MSRALLLVLGIVLAAANATPAHANQKLRQLELKSGQRTVKSIAGTQVILTGDAVLVLPGQSPKVADGQVHFTRDAPDAVVVFDQVRPSMVQEKFLSSIFIDDEPAVHGKNVRLTATPTGTILFPHGPDYAALLTYKSTGMKGKPCEFVIHQYYKSKELGEDEDQIESFILKKGYMATFAENQDGTGSSQVFIAHHEDLEVKRLPESLRGKVSFIRVFPWRYTGKKGFGGKLATSELLQTQWHYNWSAGSQPSLDIEFVPMRHNAKWDSFKKINQLENVTHVLGFNEPNQSDQANMSVKQALAMWPKLQASGLRLGSPSPNDADRGLKWLFEFMDEADKRGLRVDFVTVHFYKANWSADQLIRWLQKIHKRTGGRPIWLTEFNNGARWSKGHNPTYAENAKKLNDFCKIMDKAKFVERYAIFNAGPDTMQRQLIRKGKLTPAGKWYERYIGAEAYTP